jgi:hypothetical protein
VKPTIGLLVGTFDKGHLRELAPTAHWYKGSRPEWWRIAIGED